jgi:hypothetical protein
MGITVLNAANPSVTLGAAYGAANVEEQKKLRLQQLQRLQDQRDLQDRQAFQEKMTQSAQGFSADQAAAERDFHRDTNAQQQSFRERMLGTEQAFQADREYADRERLRQAHYQDMEAKGFEFILTPDQIAQREKLKSGLAELDANVGGNRSREEIARMRPVILSGLEAIQPAMTPKPASKYPKGRAPGDTYTTPEGYEMQVQPGGVAKKIGESRAVQKEKWAQDRELKQRDFELKAWEMAIKAATTKDDKSERVDMQKAREAYGKFMGTTVSALGPQDNSGLGPNPTSEQVYQLSHPEQQGALPALAPPPRGSQPSPEAEAIYKEFGPADNWKGSEFSVADKVRWIPDGQGQKPKREMVLDLLKDFGGDADAVKSIFKSKGWRI